MTASEYTVDIGRTVLCDYCNEDWTDCPESGGFIAGSYACCPACTQHQLQLLRRYDEEHHIRARCPQGVSFADFVRDYRGPEGGRIKVQEFELAEDLIASHDQAFDALIKAAEKELARIIRFPVERTRGIGGESSW